MVRNPPANAGDIRDTGSIPGSGRSPGEGNGNLLQYSCLENPMVQGAWQAYSLWGRKQSDMTEWLMLWLFHGIWSHHFMGNWWGNSGNSVRLYFGGSKITADGDCRHEIKRRLLLGRKVMTNLDSIFKSRDIALPTKVCPVKAMVFPVVMYGYESWTEESWVTKNWCFWTVVLEKTLESPLDCKEIKPVNPKGNQPWIFTWRTGAEAPTLWPPDVKSWSHRERLWRWERLKAKEEAGSRGWDGKIASLTQ